MWTLYTFEIVGDHPEDVDIPIELVLDWSSSWLYLPSLLLIYWALLHYVASCLLVGVTCTFISWLYLEFVVQRLHRVLW